MAVSLHTEKLSERGRAAGTGDVLSIDVGGTLIKAAVVAPSGELVSEFRTVPTPKPATPDAVIALLRDIVEQLPPFTRISVGFPGVVSRGRTITAPNLGTQHWKDVAFASTLSRTFRTPVRILNDAVMYGLGVARGPGRECVLTLGTGMGCALFCDGAAFFGLELGQHVAEDSLNYDQYVGHAAFLEIGLEAWNARVARALAAVHALTNVDRMFIGGGNSRRVTFPLPPWVTIAEPSAGVAGGARLWHPDLDRWFADDACANEARSE